MTRNFYFQNEGHIVTGAVLFANLIAAAPETYGISPERAASFGVLSAALKSAFATATAPATRTTVAVGEKNLALKAMRAEAINLARIISANPAVDDGQLIGLGLLPRATRTPKEAPSDPPSLNVTAVSGRVVSILVRPKGSPRRGKAFGAAGANLFSFVGENPPANTRDYHFEQMTTRAKTQIVFPNEVPSGATVWLSACWVSARGQTSPGSSPVNFTLQGGAVLPVTSLVA